MACFDTVVLDGDASILLEMPAEAGVYMDVGGAYPKYRGETEITPLADGETVLETAYKVLLSDIRVLKIPYTEVSNLSGGLTVSIA